jgi:glyoxylase-like metal-dependent hydrolase (beta-lactamase superfamily II)
MVCPDMSTSEVKPAASSASFGANVGAVIDSDAVLVVDTLMSAAQGGCLLSAVRQITDRPIRYVVNTHHHMDHTWGNCVFAAAGATVIGHEYTRQVLHDPPTAWHGRNAIASPPRAWPAPSSCHQL